MSTGASNDHADSKQKPAKCFKIDDSSRGVGFAFFPDGKRLLGWNETTMKVWAMEESGGEVAMKKSDTKYFGAAVFPDGRRVLRGHGGGGLKVWDCETGEVVEVWKADKDVMDSKEAPPLDAVFCVTFSPSGELVASGDLAGHVALRNAESGKVINDWVVQSRSRGWPRSEVPFVYEMSFSPDGKRLAVGLEWGTFEVFDVGTGRLVLGPIRVCDHSDSDIDVACTGILWSRSGSQLLSSSTDGIIKRWNSLSGKSIGDPFVGHADRLYGISISPNGTTLASVSKDRTLRFWDVESGRQIGKPLKHDDEVWFVAFSPTGDYVATGCHDGHVCLWRPPGYEDDKKSSKRRWLDVCFPAPHEELLLIVSTDACHNM
jgi:WD40 repeat protein